MSKWVPVSSGVINEVKPGKQLGAPAVSWSVGLVCLRMHGIPRAPGHRAYSSMGRKAGAVCVERLAVFC